MDEAAFPDISFATSAASRQQHPTAGEGKGASASGGGGGGSGGAGAEGEDDTGRWDGQGRIEEAEIVSGR